MESGKHVDSLIHAMRKGVLVLCLVLDFPNLQAGEHLRDCHKFKYKQKVDDNKNGAWEHKLK